MVERVGQQLGNYQIVNVLGRGGFADTYLGKHIYLESFAAIKVLQAHLQQQDEQTNFLNEARTIARLKHPNIVQVFDFGVDHDANTPYLVMDYAPNGTLRQRHRRGVPIPITTILPYVKQVAAALQYAHEQNIIHRDVKPENMLLSAKNEVLLSDFGIAIMVQNTYSHNAQNIAGTVTYMAPEQLQGKARPASDQYALAMIVYEWLCGVAPFQGTFVEVAVQQERAAPTPLRQHVPTISADVEQVVLTAISKDPRQRFGSILAFANALEQASKETPIEQQFSQALPISNAPLNVPQNDSGSQDSATVTAPTRKASGTQHSVHKATTAIVTPKFSEALPSSTIPSNDGNAGQTKTLVSPGILHNANQTRLLTTTNKILLGIVALLLLLLSSGGIYYAGVYHPNQERVEATSTAVGRITGTAQAQKNAIASAGAQATSAAIATATTAQTLYNQATSGTPVITDPLSTPDNYGWQHFSDQNGACNFVGGAYQVRVQGHSYNPCMAAGIHVTDFAMQVQMTTISGELAGIAFRSPYGQNNDNSGYLLFIGMDGTYGLYKPAHNAAGTLTKIIVGIDPFIHIQLNQQVVLTLIAKGSNFSIYLNKQFVASCSDTTYSSGSAGLLVGSTKNGTEATFSNLQIWQL